MPFERTVLIDGIVYGYHRAASATSDADGSRVYVESWESADDAQNPAKSPRVRAFAVPDTAEAAVALLASCEAWARDNEYPEYIDGAQAALDAVLPILTDEQAEQVPDAFPPWSVGKAYKVGDRVRYDGVLYKCVQAHTSQEGWEPPSAVSLWSRIGEPAEYPEWIQPTGAHDAYAKGDKVSHAGKHWSSDIDANTYEPGVYGWTEE